MFWQWRILGHSWHNFVTAEDTVEPRHFLSYQMELLFFQHGIWKEMFRDVFSVFRSIFFLKCCKKIFNQHHSFGLNYSWYKLYKWSWKVFTFLSMLFSSSVKLAALRLTGNGQMDTPNVEITSKYSQYISSILFEISTVSSLLSRFWSQNRMWYEKCIRNING